MISYSRKTISLSTMFRERSIIIISLSTIWVDYSIKAISREMAVISGFYWLKKKGVDNKNPRQRRF